eukprot:245508_1
MAEEPAILSVWSARSAMENGRGASNPQRMVCEVRNGKVNDDPHTCGGQNQGGGLKEGFNKWWNGWDAIHEMNAIAQKHCVKPVKFVVVAGGQVVHESKQIATCKEYLMKNYGRGASNPQRMVCEVRNGKWQRSQQSSAYGLRGPQWKSE